MTLETINMAVMAAPRHVPSSNRGSATSAGRDDSFDSVLAEQRSNASRSRDSAANTAAHEQSADAADKQHQASASQAPEDSASKHDASATKETDESSAKAGTDKADDTSARAEADAQNDNKAVAEGALSEAASQSGLAAAATGKTKQNATEQVNAAKHANGKAGAKQAATQQGPQTAVQQLAALKTTSGETTAGKGATDGKGNQQAIKTAVATANAAQGAKAAAQNASGVTKGIHNMPDAKGTGPHSDKAGSKAALAAATDGKTTTSKSAAELIAGFKVDSAGKTANQQTALDGARAIRAMASATQANNSQTAMPTPLHGLTTGLPMATGQQITASSPVTLSAAPTFTAQLQAPVGTQGWNQALQQQSVRLLHSGGGRAQLTLYPAELGKIQVSLKMGSQAQAQLHFVAPNVQARAAVQAALPQLQQAFADSGINLGQTSVSEHSHQSFDSQAQQHSGGSSNKYYNGNDMLNGDEPTAVTITRIAGRTATGGIDIFA